MPVDEWYVFKQVVCWCSSIFELLCPWVECNFQEIVSLMWVWHRWSSISFFVLFAIDLCLCVCMFSSLALRSDTGTLALAALCHGTYWCAVSVFEWLWLFEWFDWCVGGWFLEGLWLPVSLLWSALEMVSISTSLPALPRHACAQTKRIACGKC